MLEVYSGTSDLTVFLLPILESMDVPTKDFQKVIQRD
jgi:hypothetical protein